MRQGDLVNIGNFIVATRDSGYKSTAAALAELVDNAIEANATKIHIQIHKHITAVNGDYELSVIDNGKGMSADELGLALQFGGSTRFNSRSQLGRYGMGLPNSSLSQCKRVEVE
jgi:sensor histidine kinase regulating citrate/malate metabolism